MTGKVVYDNRTKLFTLTGHIAVHLLDGDVIKGEFATQDAYNVFVMVDGEPRLIPRVQIRWIAGLQGQQIERDTSQEEIEDPLSTQPLPEEQHTEPVTEVRMPADSPQPEPEPESEIPESEPEPGSEEDTAVLEDEEEEGTLVIVPNNVAQSEPEDEDDGTLILVAEEESAPEEEEEEEEEDGTVVLSGNDQILAAIAAVEEETTAESDEMDMTMVLGRDIEIPEILQDDELFATETNEPTATLTCISGPHQDQIFKVESGITTMGRSVDNVVVLSKDKEISRRHAIVLQESGRYVVQDQNSLNGTFVNEEQITSPRYLENGDVILVGVSSLRFEEN